MITIFSMVAAYIYKRATWQEAGCQMTLPYQQGRSPDLFYSRKTSTAGLERTHKMPSELSGFFRRNIKSIRTEFMCMACLTEVLELMRYLRGRHGYSLQHCQCQLHRNHRLSARD